jgi:hypothetical protein
MRSVQSRLTPNGLLATLILHLSSRATCFLSKTFLCKGNQISVHNHFNAGRPSAETSALLSKHALPFTHKHPKIVLKLFRSAIMCFPCWEHDDVAFEEPPRPRPRRRHRERSREAQPENARMGWRAWGWFSPSNRFPVYNSNNNNAVNLPVSIKHPIFIPLSGLIALLLLVFFLCHM